MRFIVFGAGAIGGLVGGRLFQSGHDVTLVARGEHFQALSKSGLQLESPVATDSLPVPVVDNVGNIVWRGDEIVLLGVKGQHTDAALDELQVVAHDETPVVCMQNGVENERRVLRRFRNTYAMCVMCPGSHLAPGVVQCHSHPVSGLLDIGCYPSGLDDTAELIASAMNDSTFDSVARQDIMRWKYFKLLMNLWNSVDALCGSAASATELGRRVRKEGEMVLNEAGIAFVTREEDKERRGRLLTVAPTASGPHGGGSSWQSLARGAGSIEVDYLNGEIALIGSMNSIPTPVNSLLQRLAHQAVREGWAPGSQDPDAILAMAKR